MKIVLCTVIAFLGVTSAFAEADPAFINFSVKGAHSRGFTRCDSAVREVFDHAGGKDIRVWTDTMADTEKDQLQISGAYGSDGDMVFIDANIRLVNNKCIIQESTTIIADQSCTSYLSDNAVWKVESSTGDVTGAKNGKGVKAILRPAGKMCIVTFRRGAITRAG